MCFGVSWIRVSLGPDIGVLALRDRVAVSGLALWFMFIGSLALWFMYGVFYKR